MEVYQFSTYIEVQKSLQIEDPKCFVWLGFRVKCFVISFW